MPAAPQFTTSHHVVYQDLMFDTPRHTIAFLSAPEKIGKTTLLSLLLDRRRAGGELLGRTVYPGKTVLCTEERDQLWNLRQPPLDFGPDLTFLHPNGDNPTRRHWNRTVNDVCEVLMPEEGF